MCSSLLSSKDITHNHLLVPILPSNTPVIFTQYCACNFCHRNYDVNDDNYDGDDVGDCDGNGNDDDKAKGDVDDDDIDYALTSKTWEQSVRKCETTGKLGSHSSVHE